MYCFVYSRCWIKSCNKSAFQKILIRLLLWLGWINSFYRFTVAPETTKEQDKLYETMALKTFHIKQQRKEIPERGGSNEMCLVIIPDFCLEKIPSSEVRNRKYRQSQVDSLSSGDRAGSPGTPGQLRDKEEYCRGENSGGLQRVPLKYLIEHWLVHPYE